MKPLQPTGTITELAFDGYQKDMSISSKTTSSVYKRDMPIVRSVTLHLVGLRSTAGGLFQLIQYSSHLENREELVLYRIMDAGSVAFAKAIHLVSNR
jgi:hypothetical protein